MTTNSDREENQRIVLETQHELRVALAEAVRESTAQEEEIERLKEELKKQIEIERPKFISEQTKDLQERFKRAEIAIERKRKDASQRNFALAELQATKVKLAEAL